METKRYRCRQGEEWHGTVCKPVAVRTIIEYLLKLLFPKTERVRKIMVLHEPK
jgi:hypothetical protein